MEEKRVAVFSATLLLSVFRWHQSIGSFSELHGPFSSLLCLCCSLHFDLSSAKLHIDTGALGFYPGIHINGGEALHDSGASGGHLCSLSNPFQKTILPM